jgi:hypothetical protein
MFEAYFQKAAELDNSMLSARARMALSNDINNHVSDPKLKHPAGDHVP